MKTLTIRSYKIRQLWKRIYAMENGTVSMYFFGSRKSERGFTLCTFEEYRLTQCGHFLLNSDRSDAWIRAALVQTFSKSLLVGKWSKGNKNFNNRIIFVTIIGARLITKRKKKR